MQTMQAAQAEMSDVNCLPNVDTQQRISAKNWQTLKIVSIVLVTLLERKQECQNILILT